MKTKALAREDRLTQIIQWFAIRVQNSNEAFATPHEIARGLGLSPSTKFRSWLVDLEKANRLESKPISKSGRWSGKVYMLKEGTFNRPKRSISLKVKGKPAGQLELFQ